MSAHGSDFAGLSDEFFAGIRTAAAIDKAKGKAMPKSQFAGPLQALTQKEEIDRLLAENSKLKGQLEELVAALSSCMFDIVALMHDTYGDTAILPLSHDRATALLSKLKEAGS